jgi:hypothetical protein
MLATWPRFRTPCCKSPEVKPAAIRTTIIAGNTIEATIPPAPNINQYIGSSERVGRN